MAGGRGRRGTAAADFWPGYVDILSSLLLVVTFLMSLFMLAQFFVSQESSGKDTALKRLTEQLNQLTDLLSLEKNNKKTLEEELASMSATLSSTETDKKRLADLLAAGEANAKDATARSLSLGTDLNTQKLLTSDAIAKVDLVNQQLLALRRQVAALEAALNASESKDKESQTKISDLGARLNLALAKKVQELSEYRSEFFGRLKELLKDRKEIQVVGDRFVFQAEVLFPSGSDLVNPEGLSALGDLATAIRELDGKIPREINWVLRVDGHTDARPISTPLFKSNWELSSARAIAVVKFLIAQGVPATRLAAAGFGEFQPLDASSGDAALSKNRRIELKLTER